MKIIIPLIGLAFFISCNVQRDGAVRKIIIDKNTLSKKELQTINPKFLDTIFSHTSNGKLSRNIQVRKGLDTLFVEDSITGAIRKVISDPQKDNLKQQPFTPKTADTVYIEDPVTGKIRISISQ